MWGFTSVNSNVSKPPHEQGWVFRLENGSELIFQFENGSDMKQTTYEHKALFILGPIFRFSGSVSKPPQDQGWIKRFGNGLKTVLMQV